MERLRLEWLDSERHYLQFVAINCRKLRVMLLPLFDACNTCEFFWSVERIIETASIADVVEANILSQHVPPSDCSGRCITSSVNSKRLQKCDDDSNESDENEYDDEGDDNDDVRLDPELMSMPLLKLLKLELEALFKITRQRKKLLLLFTMSNSDLESRVFNDRRDLQIAEKALAKLKVKVPKYKTMLEYQTLLGAVIVVKFSQERIQSSRPYHTLLTLRFTTLRAVVQRVAKTCRDTINPDELTDSALLSIPEEDEPTHFPLLKYFTKAYGHGFIDTRRYWSEIMSLMVATIQGKFVAKRKKSESAKDKKDESKDTKSTGVKLLEKRPIDPWETHPLNQTDIYMKAVKDFNGTDKNDMALKKGQIVKQKVCPDASGRAFGWSRPSFLRKKKSGFYPVTCVMPKSTSLK